MSRATTRSSRLIAWAFGWELMRRHRWGLKAVGLYFVGLAAIRLVLGLGAGGVSLEEDWQFALLVIVPMASTFAYFLGIFSYGLDGDLAARRSTYPSRRFTLPVTSAALAGWPMLFGALAMAGAWLLTRGLALWPAGISIPWLWPTLLAVVMVGWVQALAWMPYPRRGIRVALIVFWQSIIAFGSLFALELSIPESTMLAWLAPHPPLAFFFAWWGVARARRGVGTYDAAARGAVEGGGRRAEQPLEQHVEQHVEQPMEPRAEPLEKNRPQGPGSPLQALDWLEWRSHGRSLPILVAIVLPLELLLLFIFRETASVFYAALIGILLTPPFLATFVAATVRSSPGGAGRHGHGHALTPFVAARPVTDVDLIRAKLRVTWRSAVLTWGFVLLTLAIVLALSGTAGRVIADGLSLANSVGLDRVFVATSMILAWLVLGTWKQLIQGLYVGLSGRPWMIKGRVFLTLTLLTILAPLVPWALRRAWVLEAIFQSLPWILGVWVCAKTVASLWVAARLHRRGIFEDRALVLGAFAWGLSVFGLWVVLVWLLPNVLFHAHVLALVAIWAVPLVRLSAAPLALSWNRHR